MNSAASDGKNSTKARCNSGAFLPEIYFSALLLYSILPHQQHGIDKSQR